MRANADAIRATRKPSWIEEKLFLGQTLPEYLKSLVTPFNGVASLIILVGAYASVIRFTQGLGASTNLSNLYPWGLWIGFDVLSGVALAAGGYTLATTVYILRLKEYQPIVRPAILTGFLGYFFVVVGLLFDLGRPWRLPYPMVVSFGVTSVMFLVAWHVALYLTCQFVEFSPAIFEWLGWKRFRQWSVRITLGVTIFGVMLSTLHQSALGGMFLLAPTKLHPLWYSPLLPIFFFGSSIFAGLSVVIMESSLAHRFFHKQTVGTPAATMDRLVLGLGKAAAVVMFTYFGIKMVGVMHQDAWGYLGTPLGLWFMVEVGGFVLLPCALFLYASAKRSARIVRWTAAWTVLGIVLNRINVSMVAFNWQETERYFPRWSEFAITLAIVTALVLTYRWVVNRMPVLRPHPEFGTEE
ncbi:MAG: NrfD/PsrC family molybdoenzyme membrane anchor subunit [Chloroflexota bacterium]